MLFKNSAAQFVIQDWTCKLSSSWCVFWRNRLQYLSVSYKAWFQCGGYVNCQNYRYQSTENPGLIHKVPLHDIKNGVQYAESNWGIMGPIFFFLETINSHWYVTHIVTPFLYICPFTRDTVPFAAWQCNRWSHKQFSLLCTMFFIIEQYCYGERNVGKFEM